MRKLALATVGLSAGLLVLFALRGSTWKQLDQASACIAHAKQASAEARWLDAASEYTKAQAAWPSSLQHSDQYYLLRLATEHARVRAGQIDDALEKITQLSNELKSAGGVGPQVQIECRRELAMTAYYKAWLSRRQGLSSKMWEPLLTSARQDFEYLARSTLNPSDHFSDKLRSNAQTIRQFEQLDNEAVYAAPLPEPALASNLGLNIAPEPKSDPSTNSSQNDGRLRMNFEIKPSGGGAATPSKFKGS